MTLYLAAVSSVGVSQGPGLRGGAGVEPHPAPGVTHGQEGATGVINCNVNRSQEDHNNSSLCGMLAVVTTAVWSVWIIRPSITVLSKGSRERIRYISMVLEIRFRESFGLFMVCEL